MRRPIAILLVTLGLVAGCGGGATATPAPSATPAPTDIFSESASPGASVAPASEVPITSPGAGQSYTIKKGDTMYAIAQKLGVTLAALKAANPGVDPKSLRVGATLVIPAK